MSQKLNEQLSAFVDNELSEFEQHQLLKHIDKKELRDSWARYHLIKDAISGEAIQPQSMDISAQVSAALASEESYHEQNKLTDKPWAKIAGGAAIAASVAMVTVFSFTEQTEQLPIVGAVSMQTDKAPENVQWDLQTVGTRWAVDKPEVENTLNRYLLEHSDQTSRSGVAGMLPYATLAGYDRK